MDIRRARPEDAVAISDLNRTVQTLHARAYPHLFKPPAPGTFTPDEVLAMMAQSGNVFFIAIVDDRPAGYVYAQIAHRPESAIRRPMELIYVHHFSVDEAFQGQGVGSALMTAIRDLAQAESISHLEVDVWSFNDRALTFFEHQGFSVYNQRLWMDLGDQ